MAQLWLTYEEMTQEFGGTPESARAGAIENGWARIKGRDGLTHVRLPDALADRYLRTMMAGASAGTDTMVSSLRSIVRSARDEVPIAGSTRAA